MEVSLNSGVTTARQHIEHLIGCTYVRRLHLTACKRGATDRTQHLASHGRQQILRTRRHWCSRLADEGHWHWCVCAAPTSTCWWGLHQNESRHHQQLQLCNSLFPTSLPVKHNYPPFFKYRENGDLYMTKFIKNYNKSSYVLSKNKV